MSKVKLPINILPKVDTALNRQDPVVALESTIIAHGFPWPYNLHLAQELENSIEEAGAVPATIAIIDGIIKIGCTDKELERVALGKNFDKISRQNLITTLAGGKSGATTVAGTMICAALAGIRLLATGGLGGVHRDAKSSFDISADLMELQHSPVVVVCSGVKAMLDIPGTLEVLETNGVPVIGYRTAKFPAFYSIDSGLPTTCRVNNPQDAAKTITQLESLGGGAIIANPPPAEAALQKEVVDDWIRVALGEASRAGVTGKNITPYLLSRLADLSTGQTLEVNHALAVSNASLAGTIAVALYEIK